MLGRVKKHLGAAVCRIIDWAKRENGQLQSEKISKNGSLGSVGADVILVNAENIQIGRDSYVNGGFLIASPNARIIIGKDCMISYGVHLRTDMHRHDLSSPTPMRLQGYSEADIVICDNVWIGFGAQIMSGVTVGSNSIIAAGAVVTKDVPSGEVWGGVPARRIA